MTTCFLCGKPIPNGEWQFRHRVKVGDSISRTYGTNKVRRTYSRFQSQVVCGTCHERIEAGERRQTIVAAASAVVLALAVLVGAVLLFLQGL